MLTPPRASLIGRETDLARLVDQIDAGLTTLTGVGGVGKTSLALGVLGATHARFGDAWFCELAGVSEANAVDDAVADAIGAFRNSDATAVEAVASALHGRRALLVLDNVEQVVGGAGRFVAALLVACPDVAVLATSREALRIGGEIVIQVQPLDLERGAPQLFRRHAEFAAPGLDLSAHEDDIRAICHALDGLPLALELAAAQLATLSIGDVRERLDQRFGLLRGDSDEDRHATLAAAIRWSYDLLAPHERRLFDRLSVFHGGFDVEGAAALTGAIRDPQSEQRDVASVLNSLTNKSMLVRSDLAGGPRWDMLESLRHFGDRQLAEHGERSSIRNAHLDRMVVVASQASGACRSDQWQEGVERFRTEWDNVRAAIEWAVGTQRARDVDRLLRDVFVMARWTLESEPSVWAAHAIERGAVTGVPVGAPAHLHAAFGEFLAGRHEAALASNLRALEAESTSSDRGWARHYAAIELLYLGRTAESAATADYAIIEPAARVVERAMQQSAHAVFKLLAGQMEAPEADKAIEAASELAASVGNPVAQGHVAYNLGMVASVTGRADEASVAFAVAMALGRSHGIPNLIGYALTAQVYMPGDAGLGIAREALDWWRDHRDVGNEYVVIEATGINLVESGRLEDGGVLLGHIEQDPRRIASSAARRDDAIAVLQNSRRGRQALHRGATIRRAELLDHARTSVMAALER